MLKFKNSNLIAFSFILFSIGFINKQIKAQCHIDDWTALKAFYESTDGDNWNNNRGWEELVSSTPSVNCNLGLLYGVSLDIEEGRVKSLYLSNNLLSGSIPAELGNLSNLKSLSLGNEQISCGMWGGPNGPVYIDLSLIRNQLGGSIPVELGNLSMLEYLKLNNNQLSGSIPAQLGNLSNLETLYLYGNQLSGSIPPQLGNLSKLRFLCIEDNQLEGSIPAELANLNNLDYLWLQNNQLNGSIPTELGNLSNLYHLVLDFNQLSGSIPAELSNLSDLSYLGLENNNFSGCYNTSLKSLCGKDGYIDKGNNFYADWEDFCNNEAGICFENKPNCHRDDWFVLKDFYTRTNGINWAINEGWQEVMSNKSTDTCDLSTLFGISLDIDGSVSEINLLNNNLSGDISPFLADLTNLKALKIAYNDLSGCYYPDLKELCTQLPANNEAVSDGNNLSADWEDFCLLNAGVCTKCHIDDWSALKALYESTNGNNWINNAEGWQEVTGNSPSANCNLNMLSGVFLDEQGRVKSLTLGGELSGSIPAQLGNLSNLTSLDLGGNQLSGSIPVQLGNLNKLTSLDLGGNQLSGSIPAHLSNLSNLESLNLSDNQFSDSIPAQLGNLNNLTFLYLTNNQLSGSIPANLSNLSNLESLGLSSNQFSSSIPAQLGNLSNLGRLELNNNQLSGIIPPQLGNLSNLKFLNLSYNQLSGSIPAQLSNLSKLTSLDLEENNFSGCYETSLIALCSQLWHWTDINEGNNFYVDWEDFCDNEAGICFENKPKCHRDDWFVLKDFYTKTNGINWAINEGWEEVQGNKPTAECDLNKLFGINLDIDSRVSEINLLNNNLSGAITPVLGDLSNLKTLKIANNDLGGCYAPGLKQLCSRLLANNETVSDGNNLNTAWEDFCLLDAGVCTNCHSDDWTALKALYESTNGNNWSNNEGWQEFAGAAPTANCNLKVLSAVDLDEEGRVKLLYLPHMQLSGSLPSELSNLSNLESLYLKNNQLTGEIPIELGNLSNLLRLNLSYNKFSSIPAHLSNLSNLESIDLSNNKLSGSIPLELGNLSKLENLSLSNNKLSGSIPLELGNLRKLEILSLASNQLSGSIPLELGNLSNLLRISFSYNQLSDSIPAELGNLSKVSNLNFSNNQLSGNLPEELGNLSNLEFLFLENNQISGSIPAQLGNLSKLRDLILKNNQLTDSIPAQLGNLSNLSKLNLSNNQLSSSIPAQLGNLSNGINLDFGYNQLSGSIPTELDSIIYLTLKINHNYYSCADIQTYFQLFEEVYFSEYYTPQYFKPENYEMIKSNVFDTLSIDQRIEIEFPFDTTGFSYQWFRNGDSIPSYNQATLNLDTIQPKNAGEYTLQLTNENCLPNEKRFTTISEPIYIILKGYDLYGQPVEYDQIMVEFDNAEDTQQNKDDFLYPNGGWVKKACNCNRELYLWQFPSTEDASKALIEIDKKWKRIKNKSKITGGFNNLVKIEEAQNSSLAYKVLSETLQMDYPDSVIVYILDSGLDDQSLDADASFIVNNAPIDSCYAVESQIGYSYVDSTNSTIPVSNNYKDELWHGTYGFHSITESLNENHKLKVIPLKTFDKNGTGNLFDMTCALHHAINHNADVINISAGYQGQPSAILEAAINEARKKGIFITAAAGNDSINIDTLAQYPAYYASQYNRYENVDDFGNVQLDSIKYDNVISIASINENNNISSFSNVGKQSVTMAAYGENIHGYGLGNDEIVALGTSMSTYYVTKELALEIAANKNRTYQQIWNDFEQNRLVANNSLEAITQTGKQLKVKLEVASITGCINPAACNYFEYATVDDGTCQFAAYHPSDLAALKALYVSANGDNWKRNYHWETLFQNTISSPCSLNELYGVWLNEAGRVYRINLYNNNLSGQIPVEIEGLTELNELYLAANNLSGEIPVELTKLDKITDLVLSANYLSGNIPLEMAELNELKRLNLSYNQLGGEIPPQLGQLNQLKYLKLNNNKLIGNIPGELALLKNLYLLNISNNLLSGCFENNLEQLCNQKWSPLFKGNANISDGNSFEAIWENFCSNKEGACESINRLNNKPKMFSLYPNPSEGKLFIKFSTNEYKNNILKISNLEGKCILKIEGKHINDNTFEMDLGDLPKGMYILELQNEYKNYAEKFILK